jgi:hypothetical protein
MIPNIFISSTIGDLTYLRDSIRDLIYEIGYTPIMSEYGDVGYLPTTSAEDSCYITMRNCQLAVLIIGKKYGSISSNGLSVTHNEFRAAVESKIPVIFLVDHEMMSFKKVFDLNDGKITIPGVEKPKESFGLIQEFINSDINNGLVAFSNAQSAKDNLRKQLAHLFSELLKNRFDPIKGEIKDILSEISTLKHILLKNEKEIAIKFSKAFRILLSDKNRDLKEVSEMISGSLETAVQELLDSASFQDYLTKKQVEIKEIESNFLKEQEKTDIFNNGITIVYSQFLPTELFESEEISESKNHRQAKSKYRKENEVVFAVGERKFWGNSNAFKLMESMYKSLKSSTNA